MIKFTKDQLVNMLALQDKLNVRINPEWRQANFPWYRAAWMEDAELLEHIGWKWWKKQDPDYAQAQLEVVDIWHFCLSFCLQAEGTDLEHVAGEIADDVAKGVMPMHDSWKRLSIGGEQAALLATVEMHATQCLANQFVSPAITLHLAEKVGLSADQMYKQYVTKNLLNMFRQDHGYKEGTYRKVWRGLEDNQVVSQWFDARPEWTPEELLAEMGRSYGDQAQPSGS